MSPVVLNVTRDRPIHPLNAKSPIVVTPFGIVIVELVSGHISNARSPIVTSPDVGNVRLVKLIIVIQV